MLSQTANNKRKPNSRPRTIRASQPVAESDPVPNQPVRQGHKGIAKSVGKPVDRENAAEVSVAFQPRAVSSESTTEKNDPLLKSSILIEGAASMTLSKRFGRFENDYSGFIQLVRSSYEASARKDAKFGKSVSESQYLYYCVLLLWRRLTKVASGQDRQLKDLCDYLHMRMTVLTVPEDIADYLAGVGEVSDFAGVPRTLAIGTTLSAELINGLSGHYGRVDAETHIYYETIPSPFVALASIVHEYAYSMASRSNAIPADWDLPAALKPLPGEQEPTVVPNYNLLGWSPSTKMTDGQQRLSRDNGVYAALANRVVTYVVNGVTNDCGFPLAVPLVESISAILGSARAGPVTTEPVSLAGSKAQVIFISRGIEDDDNPTVKGKHLIPVYRSAGTPASCAAASANMASAASLFRYRVNRLVKDHTDSLCYTGDGGAALDGWVATANRVFQKCSFWNTEFYHETQRYADDSTRVYCNRIRGGE